MTDPGTLALVATPALGVMTCIVLYIATGLADRRALRRADAFERRTAEG